METRKFNTIDVLEVWTGKRLPGYKEGFHGVMDFFYPGIMTIGCAMKMEDCKKLLETQLPDEVKKITFTDMTSENCEAMLKEALQNLPTEIALTRESGISQYHPLDEIKYAMSLNPDIEVMVL